MKKLQILGLCALLSLAALADPESPPDHPPVPETFQPPEVSVAGLSYKIVRCVIHARQQVGALGKNGFSLSPGQ